MHAGVRDLLRREILSCFLEQSRGKDTVMLYFEILCICFVVIIIFQKVSQKRMLRTR
jgi:hypothetical protein